MMKYDMNSNLEQNEMEREQEEYMNYYLHGHCDEWVMLHYRPEDKACIIIEHDEYLNRTSVMHCYIKRGEKFLDVRGYMNTFDDVLDAFDWGEYQVISCNNLDDFVYNLKCIYNQDFALQSMFEFSS